MAQQVISTGTAPNDGTGTPLRDACEMINDNFAELYAAVAGVGSIGIWSLFGSWTWSTNVANVDFTGLAGLTDAIVIFRNITLAVAGQPALQLSTNNGSTYFSTSGDYVAIVATGVETATTLVAVTNTSVTAARSGVGVLRGINVNGAPKFLDRPNRDDSGVALFVGSTSPVTAIRCLPSNAGNLTGGSIYIFAR